MFLCSLCGISLESVCVSINPYKLPVAVSVWRVHFDSFTVRSSDTADITQLAILTAVNQLVRHTFEQCAPIWDKVKTIISRTEKKRRKFIVSCWKKYHKKNRRNHV